MYVFLYLIESLQMDQNFLTLGKKLFRFSQRAGLVWRWLTNTFVFLWIGTGWLLMSVDCNLFLMGPKISKSAKTQLFLGSSSWEVLVFWCFKTVRCVKICLLKLFQYRVFATQYKAWALPYTLIRIQTLNKSISSTQIPLEKLLRHPSDICRQHKTVKDVIRHQQMPIDVNINCHTSLLFGVCWCLLLSWGVPRYLEEVSESIWVKCMYVCWVWMRLRDAVKNVLADFAR